jgi:hypothetical protein
VHATSAEALLPKLHLQPQELYKPKQGSKELVEEPGSP